MASNYDPTTNIRRVDPSRWTEFDGPQFMKLQESEETWLRHFNEVELGVNAPVPVRKMFEACRGAMIYSFFYYPLATLGMDHSFRTLELAVRFAAGDPEGNKTYFKNIAHLAKTNQIPTEKVDRFHAARELRNFACHPNGNSLWDPGQALGQLHRTAELIDFLFPGESG